MRKGIDDDHLTYVEAGLAAQEAGVAAVALHARTAAQRYSGHAPTGTRSPRSSRRSTCRCSATATSGRPTTRCGWSRDTGCDGVVVGRGCLGRPWLFADLEAAFAGRPRAPVLPALGEVAAVMRRHAELLVEWLGTRARRLHRLPQARRLVPQGLPGRLGAAPRRWRWSRRWPNWTTCSASSTPTRRSRSTTLGQPRGRTNAPGKVSLPDGWLADRDDDTVPEGAELDDSGG